MNEKTFTEAYTSLQADLQKLLSGYQLPLICKIEILKNTERSLNLYLQQIMTMPEKPQENNQENFSSGQ